MVPHISNNDLVKKMVFPYFACRQARVLPPALSIAWNKIAFFDYLDILIVLKDIDSPGSFLRKIRVFYDNYENEANTNPLLGDLDSLYRTLDRLEQANSQAIPALALKLGQVVSALEKMCLEKISGLRIGSMEQLEETLQSETFSLLEQAQAPGWDDLVKQQQLDFIQLMKLKNQPVNLFKMNLNHKFSAIYLTEKQVVGSLFKNDHEIKELISILNKTFFKLIHLINKKLPAPERQLKVNAAEQELSSPQDYRMSVFYLYNGADEETYESKIFSRWQHWFK